MTLRIYPLAALCLTGSAFSQTALLRVGDPAPQDATSQIATLGPTRVNTAGGFAVAFASDIGNIAIDGFWGSYTPGPGGLLLSEGTIGGFLVNLFDEPFDLMANDIAVLGGQTNGLDAIFVGSTRIAVEDDPIPGRSDFYAFVARPRVDDVGRPSFVGGLSNAPGGISLGRALFVGTSPTALFETGDMIPNLPDPLSTQAVDFDYQFSNDGVHLAMQMDMTGNFNTDKAMSIDGAGLVLGGGLVREGSPVLASIGGLPGETWGEFANTRIVNSGAYAFSSDTSEGSVIVRDGTIFHREGDTVDGQVLAGDVLDVYLNASGAIAYIWGVETSFGSVEALFLDDRLLLMEDQPVDWDGDGSLDSNTAVRGFRGGRSLSLADSGGVFFTASVDTGAGAPLDGFFAIGSDVLGTNYCGPAVPNSTGVSGTIGIFGSNVVSANSATAMATSLPANQFGIFIVSRTQGFVAGAGGSSNGNICLGGAIGRFFMGNQILSTGTGGSISLPLPLNAFPQGNGFVSVAPGDTWNFQAWHRDSVGVGSNLTDAVSVTFQ